MITRKIVLEGFFYVTEGCRDCRLYHVELREIVITTKKQFSEEFLSNGLCEIIAIPETLLRSFFSSNVHGRAGGKS